MQKEGDRGAELCTEDDTEENHKKVIMHWALLRPGFEMLNNNC